MPDCQNDYWVRSFICAMLRPVNTTELNIPDDLVVLEVAGQGRRSVTYRAELRGGIVALKVYREEFIQKYQQRYGVNIARFEFGRNQAFYELDALREYAARPIAVLGADDDYSLCFIQEFIDGIPLVELARRQSGLPASVLEAGELICARAGAAGLFDLDIFYKNVMVRRLGDVWLPVLHDFNLMPQYMYPPNPFLALAYLTGIRKKSHRDRRCLRGWKDWSDQCRRRR